jgi:DNA-directed RNA polymerase subunit H
MAFDISKHNLVPKHELLTEKQKNTLLEELHVVEQKLPKINKDDPAISHLDAKAGDVIKITRESRSAGVSIYYRVIING